MMIIHGKNPLIEAIKSDRIIIREIFIQKGKKSERIDIAVSLAHQKDVPVVFVDKKALDRLTGGATHQGIAGKTGKWPSPSLEEMVFHSQSVPLLVILDGVMDPHNLGAVIRTSECVGADAVIIPERNAVDVTPAVISASAGAAAHQNICRVKNISETIKKLKKKGIWIVGIDSGGTAPWTDIDFTVPVAVVLGEEGRGIRRLTRSFCDRMAYLPLKGRVESVNLSVAAGVILYEVFRQRREEKK